MMRRVINFYREAWRSSVTSPTGRRLWILLALKIGILLILFKILFFPNRLNTDYDNDADRAAAVRTALT
ncbi:MAG: DUF4492 domain-containing protein [Bacteroides sp.]|nr:DUF4492 domain-containing protein [Bacteroides sp.]MCM1380179.1 DUF4492 domain-containing protein [Bacteroides sp.]MCM1446506.1 DUF4492 domain-containing protein [Prevotella sp.]